MSIGNGIAKNSAYNIPNMTRPRFIYTKLHIAMSFSKYRLSTSWLQERLQYVYKGAKYMIIITLMNQPWLGFLHLYTNFAT